MIKRKHVDLDQQVIKAITQEAVEADSNFKNYVEDLLTKKAKKSKYFKDNRDI